MSDNLFSRLITRYRSGYNASGYIIALGAIIKVIGLIVGIVTALYSLVIGIALSDGSSVGRTISATIIFIGVLGGILNALLAFAIGTVFSAFGEMLKAVIDSAVNTSPHINNEEKIEVMSLLMKEPATEEPVFNYEKLQKNK
ncbi:MAG: hypothetical protein ACKVQJ_02955 [Pyrinomonadaceae bacterium]